MGLDPANRDRDTVGAWSGRAPRSARGSACEGPGGHGRGHRARQPVGSACPGARLDAVSGGPGRRVGPRRVASRRHRTADARAPAHRCQRARPRCDVHGACAPRPAGQRGPPEREGRRGRARARLGDHRLRPAGPAAADRAAGHHPAPRAPLAPRAGVSLLRRRPQHQSGDARLARVARSSPATRASTGSRRGYARSGSPAPATARISPTAADRGRCGSTATGD